MKKTFFIFLLAVLALIPFTAHADDFPGWDISGDGEVQIVYDNVGSGTAAMHIIRSDDDAPLVIRQEVSGLESGRSYYWQYWVKGDSKVELEMTMSGIDTSLKIAARPSSNGTVRRATREYSGQATAAELVITVTGEADFYLDSVMLCEDDENGESLILNGDFEDGRDMTPPAEVSGLYAQPAAGEITLRWTDPQDEDLSSVLVYMLDNNEELLIEEVDKGVQKAVISELVSGDEYTFIIKTKDAPLGNISEGVKISAVPEYVSYAVSEYIIEENRISAEIANYLSDGLTAELAVLVYNAGQLVGVYSSGEIPIPMDGEAHTVEIVSDASIIPEGCSAKIFLWDGLFKMNSLKPMQQI